MGFINISAGANIPEGWVDGVYPVILSEISDPKTVTAQRGPKAGQDIDLIDWTFVIEAGPFEDTAVEASSSTASGPKSKMYQFLTALFGGVAPPIGTSLEKGDIVGRSALATVQLDDGWLRITNLSALPANYQAAAQPAAAPAAVQAAPEAPAAVSPLKEQVAEQANRSLPF